MAAASGDYVLLLNNDVVVTPGWLDRMLSCAEKRPEIGIIGPRSNYVSGPQRVEEIDYDIHTLYADQAGGHRQDWRNGRPLRAGEF